MNESMDPILAASPAPAAQALHDIPAAPAPATALPVHEHYHHPHGLLPAIQSLLYIIVIAIFIITFTVQPFRIPSGSMEPTLLVGDFLLVNKNGLGFDESDPIFPSTAIHRGEIVIFHYPIDPRLHLIKRVIGLPGDHLRMRDGRVYINGLPLTETYAVYRPSSPDGFRDNFPRLQSTAPDIDPVWWIRMHTLVDHGELIIPSGNYFVLGDNRNGSEDSRYWGFVPRENIVGKPVVIYFSLHPGQSSNPNDPNPLGPPPVSRIATIFDFARWDRIFQIPK